VNNPGEDPARQFEGYLLSEEFCDALNAEGAVPIIVIGKSPGEGPDAYSVYSVASDPELIATTLIMAAVKIMGLPGARDIMAEMIHKRNLHD